MVDFSLNIQGGFMRVRLSYSVEVEDIISEVQRLLNKYESRLQNQVGKLHRARDEFAEEDIYRVAKEVDLTRQELARYDQTLEDCFSILQGYIGLLERNQEGDEHDESQPEDG